MRSKRSKMTATAVAVLACGTLIAACGGDDDDDIDSPLDSTDVTVDDVLDDTIASLPLDTTPLDTTGG